MDSEIISKIVDSWIHEDELPVSASLKVERTSARYFSPCEDMENEEAEAYWEYIRETKLMEHKTLLSIPRPEPEYDFWPFEFDEDGERV